MKTFWIGFLTLGVCLSALGADENVKALQAKLRDGGFYQGDVTGIYDEGTAAAVTRYQIRNGLQISGQLDPDTARALGVSPADSTQTAGSAGPGTWRRLRETDARFLKDLNSGKIQPPKHSDIASPDTSAAPQPRGVLTKSQPDPHAPPPRLPEDAPDRGNPVSPNAADAYGPDRLRDYVGAFIVAGLNPGVAAELEFYADRVTYFGEPNVTRERIRHDLERYDQRWPQRRFWLAGNLDVQPEGNGTIRVTFPLRYELSRSSDRSSGMVQKTLILRKTKNDDLEIVAVNEKKSSR